MRTAEGVQAFTSGVSGRLQYFIEQFSDLVFIPALEMIIDMCKAHLKPSQINQILTDEDGAAYNGDILDVYNGNYSLDVLSSTKLAARRAMANLIPMFIQLFSAEPVQDSLAYQNKKVNYAELVEQTFDLIGWDASQIIVDMTHEDQQRASSANNPTPRRSGEHRPARRRQGRSSSSEAHSQAERRKPCRDSLASRHAHHA
jgi:hypothetical protein